MVGNKSNSSQMKWILDLRSLEFKKKQLTASSAVHEKLHEQDKKGNKSVADFNLGNIANVQHILNNKQTTHNDCEFMFNLRKSKEIPKKARWINCP